MNSAGGISSGEIKSGIDVDMLAWFLFNIGASLNEYIMDKGTFDENDMSAADNMISFIKNGIGRK
ncbi:MAG: hypothetical protein U9R36_02080 [Elusimicrobiota bacterium]|nr:hypothetical protein [Elusimicrobiota bacterium]